ncbi:ferredoxin-1 [Bordetella bronchiseptica MBORD675]|nr:ferredoxin-1 [Bordetella bronchiseptica MBORD675]
MQVHRLRGCVPGGLFSRGSELPRDRPRRMHRLCGMHPGMPGQCHYAEEDVPQDQVPFIALNVELSAEFPSISRAKKPLEDADQWNGVQDKLQYLEK